MAHPEDQLVGRVLGGYRIDELLSSSPMGKVYKAFQLSVERYVALKFLATALRGKKAVAEAFVVGAREAASLNHRNIVRVHDVCTEEGYLFYSMEYVAGGSFRDRIGQKRLPVSTWSEVLWGANSGFLHAEQRGVFHPQLIPEHFLFSETGEVKILNMGFAASMDPVRKKLGVRFADWVFYSDPADPAGTPGNRRGEIFTAGCSLYHVMTGEPPFPGNSIEQVSARKAGSEVIPLDERTPTAPAEISSIVGRMLARDPDARYQNFSELNDEVGLHFSPESEDAYSGRKLFSSAVIFLALALGAYFLFSAGQDLEPASGPESAPVAKAPAAGPGPAMRRPPVELPVRQEPSPVVSKARDAVKPPSSIAPPAGGGEMGSASAAEKTPSAEPAGKPTLDFKELVKKGDNWRIFPGRSEPPEKWNHPDFDDSSWELNPSGFGFSSSESELTTVKTRLESMRKEKYLTLYIRKSFQVKELTKITKFRLKLIIDDGFVAYLNGVEVLRHHIKASAPAFDYPADYIEQPEGDERLYDLGEHLPLLRAGRNVFAIQGHNQSVTSSDFVLTPALEVLTLRSQLTARESEGLELELSLKAEEQVGGNLKLREYRRALASIRDLEFRFKGHPKLEDWRKKVVVGLESDLGVTIMRAENLLKLGDFSTARELVEDLNSRTPRSYNKRTKPILDAVSVGEGLVQGAEETIAIAEVEALVAIEKGDYVGGVKILDGIPEVPVKTLREGIDRVRKALDLSRWAWEKMLLGLRKFRGKRDLLVEFEPAGEDGVVPAWWLQSYKKSDSHEVSVILDSKGGSPHQGDLLELPLPVLLSFLQAGMDRLPPGEVDEVAARYGETAGIVGVQVLILCRKGPRAAWDALGRIPEKDRAAFQDGISYLGGRLLQSSILQAEAFVRFASQDDGGPDAAAKPDWVIYLRSIEDIVRRHRGLPYFKDSREKLAGLYALAAEKSLEASGLQGLVSAQVKERNLGKKKGVVQLSYDFSSSSQLTDFITLDGSASVEQGHLVLSGECRLLHGSPFRNVIEVKLIATGYAPTSPSINIALWTREGEKISAQEPMANEKTEDNARYGISADGADMPNDYLAFCLGYDMGNDSFMEVGNAKVASTAPAFAIASGARGVTLHMAHGEGTYYTYWTESVGNRLKGRQNVTLALGPKGLVWTSNSLKLHRMALRKKPEAHSWLMRTEASGSVSLFTNGRENRYDFLSIEAELDPGWLKTELQRKIAADFAALLAGN
ncbi:MAG TPA: hypothetical protein DD471_05720 [Planctomycetes bacterium]|nr:hypothetical protein [Planctomycetota bacterium]